MRPSRSREKFLGLATKPFFNGLLRFPPTRDRTLVLQTLLWLSFLLLAAGSYAVWWQAVSRLSSGGEALPRRDVERAAISPLRRTAAVFAVGLVWIAVPMLVAIQLGLVEARRRGEPPSLESVKATCLSNGLLMLLVPELLTGIAGCRLADLGIELAGWKRQLLDGFRGFLASLIPVFAVLIVTSPFRSPETQHSFLKILIENPTPATIAWITLAVVVLAPLAEELVFRVALQDALRAFLPARVAIPFVAVIFSGVHGWPDALPLVPLALILGYVYEQRRSYLAIVVLHALFNGINLLLALLTERSGVVDESSAALLGF